MPDRVIVTRELARLLCTLSHPHRIRIVEELRDDEKDVNTLQEILGIRHSGVSQHLALLRAHRLVSERREGRHVYYRLSHPQLATWLVEGLELLAAISDQSDELRHAIDHVRMIWADEEKAETSHPS